MLKNNLLKLNRYKATLFCACIMSASSSFGANETEQSSALVEKLSTNINDDVIKWRRHIHQYPELSNREYQTAEYIVKQLKPLNLDIQTGVAHTGVVAVLDTGKPGPVVALRADMDALPITEIVDLPFASKVKAEFEGNEVGVMHACGHDTHVAMLLGAAHVLHEMKDQLRGKVKFIFQPAEEGAPSGETGGAEVMVKEGVLKKPDVDVIFGLHINSRLAAGNISYRAGGVMAAVDPFKITIKGKQSHGAYPWLSVDPITTSAQLIMALQTIVSRELELIDEAAVVTVGSIHGGNRSNIIPEKVELVGTIRSLDDDMRMQIHEAVRRKTKAISESMNADYEISLPDGYYYPVTFNPADLMTQMLPTLKKTAGKEHVINTKAVTGAEDFSFFQQEVPGLYLSVGGRDPKVPEITAAGHHTPDFRIDESGMQTGVKLLTNLTIDYMNQTK